MAAGIKLRIQRWLKFYLSFCRFHTGHSSVSKEDNLLFPKRTMCSCRREQCVVPRENIVFLPKRTICCFQREQCVLSKKENVFFPKRTMCSPQREQCVLPQKNNLTLPKPVRRNRYAETVTPKPSRRNVHDESLPRRRRNHPDETETTKNFFARINSGGHMKPWN